MADNDQSDFLDPRVLNRIGRLELRARNIVEGTISGLHRSPFSGFSVEFASHREYVPGDEIKHIDWKVWARADRLYIKQYEEETNLRCTILLDCSRSMAYGDEGPGMSKFGYAATMAASLAYLLQRQQDGVGLVLFDTAVRLNLPVSSHPSHMRRIMHELNEAKPDRETDVSDVFHRLAEEIPKRGLIVLISDLFVDAETLTRALSHFRHRRHEVIVLHVMHDDELEFPFRDNTLFRGLEQDVELMTDPRALRKAYLAALEKFQALVRRQCANGGMDYVLAATGDPMDAALSAYLAFRRRSARTIMKGRRASV